MIEREFSLDSIEAGGWNPVVIEGFRLLNKAIAEVGGIPEIIKVSYEMNEQLRSLNITDDEFKRIVQAESVLWAAMTDESAIGNQARCDAEKRDIQTGVLLRKDKNVVPWHSYAVAL